MLLLTLCFFGELKCLLEIALVMAASSQCSRKFITFHPIDGYTSEWFILSKSSSVLFSEELPIKASHKYSTITLHWCPLYCSYSTVVHSCVCVCVPSCIQLWCMQCVHQSHPSLASSFSSSSLPLSLTSLPSLSTPSNICR